MQVLNKMDGYGMYFSPARQKQSPKGIKEDEREAESKECGLRIRDARVQK